MPAKFSDALQKNPLPRRLGDVELQYETSMWVGRADRPPRTAQATVAWLLGLAFGLAALGALVTRADTGTLGFLVLLSVSGFVGAAWLEQRDRRQRAFAVDFAEHVLRLDFSTPIGGMPRTLKLAFDDVRAIELSEQSGPYRVLTVDFEVSERLFREVLVANVGVKQLADAERVRRMLRAAVGLEKPEEPEPAPQGPPPVIDSFG